jgi:hypothetical protein
MIRIALAGRKLSTRARAIGRFVLDESAYLRTRASARLQLDSPTSSRLPVGAADARANESGLQASQAERQARLPVGGEGPDLNRHARNSNQRDQDVRLRVQGRYQESVLNVSERSRASVETRSRYVIWEGLQRLRWIGLPGVGMFLTLTFCVAARTRARVSSCRSRRRTAEAPDKLRQRQLVGRMSICAGLNADMDCASPVDFTQTPPFGSRIRSRK